jgi:NAD-dependent dihydropyrimidine dehydrogenase PreA subunit
MDELFVSASDSVYTVIQKEIEIVKQECSRLDNDAMVDECYNISLRFHHFEVINIVNEYFKIGYISPEQRLRLDSFYVLVHTDLCWGDDGKILHIR